MKFLSWGKDGGPESTVSGFWLVEIKSLFSIVLLRFEDGSRDAYHEHAFNSISWLLKGELLEDVFHGGVNLYLPSRHPIMTYRWTFHKVISSGTSWVLSFRGPWSKTWREYRPEEGRMVTLSEGRYEQVG